MQAMGPFNSISSFYQQERRANLETCATIGSYGGQLLEVTHSASDCSSPATPELRILCVLNKSFGVDFDNCAGKFSGNLRRDDIVLVAPGSSLSVRTRGRDALRFFPFRGSR